MTFCCGVVAGIKVIPSEDDIRLFYVDIAGPQDSMYEGGIFRL